MPESRTETQDFFTVPITPKNAVFEDDIHYPADSEEWRKVFGGDFKYSGGTRNFELLIIFSSAISISNGENKSFA